MISSSHIAVARHQKAWKAIEESYIEYARNFAQKAGGTGLVYFRFCVPSAQTTSEGNSPKSNCDVCFVEKDTSLWDTILSSSPEGKVILPMYLKNERSCILVCVGVPTGQIEGGDMLMSLKLFHEDSSAKILSPKID